MEKEIEFTVEETVLDNFGHDIKRGIAADLVAFSEEFEGAVKVKLTILISYLQLYGMLL